ncbi:MAG TPA: SRPBCC family protein [Gaiellaceae bacterium]|jgi:carbon monoxide dehydrogenase subunit G|nr:SRPBCC family protein [Gaiellaceae bacterium]
MAGRFGASTTIGRPIDDVFAFLADGENDKRFSKRIVEIKQTTPGAPGVGTVYASTAKDGGMTAKHEFELTEFQPPSKIRWTERSRTTPVSVPEGGYDLERDGEGTRLTFFNILEGRGLLGKILEPVALRSARKQADEFVASIKRVIEAG